MSFGKALCALGVHKRRYHTEGHGRRHAPPYLVAECVRCGHKIGFDDDDLKLLWYAQFDREREDRLRAEIQEFGT